jgi:succinoglycan biosynthesis protein ExoW
VRKIAVVIPYFQREAGILGRALASIYAQNIANAEIRVLVVDDASPYDPVKEIEAADQPPAHVNVEIIRRENGGPGAARNTGFEAAAKFAEFTAMLDSDDMWRPGHLKRAIEALNDGADVYFSDHLGETGAAHFPKTQFMRRIEDGEPGVEPSTVPHVRCCAGRKMIEFAAREYLAHTSSIVYRTPKLGHLRMSTQLRSAGEDHLFFLDLCLGAGNVAFSSEVEVALGAGVNIYVSAFEWGSERDLRRRIFNLGALKMMASRTIWAPEFRGEFARRQNTMRRSIGFLFVRRTLAERKLPMGEMKLAWSFDKAAVLLSPFSAVDFSIRRMLGGEKFLSDIE